MCNVAKFSYFSEMPLIYHSQINEATKIGVWHITEAEDFFLRSVTLQRIITHPNKRLQHLAGRYLLPQLFPEFPLSLVQIADTKKPFLEDEAFHFSLSHCGDYAAAIVSTRNRVGVDIEVPHPKIERIQHKFLSENELHILTDTGKNRDAMLTMAWSIKEAVFKWYGLGGVDFIGDIQIENVMKTAEGYTVPCKFKKGQPVNFDVQCISLGGNNLSWVIT